MLDRLLKLQERGRPLINSGRAAGSVIMADTELKNEIDVVYRYYYGKVVTGCKNCYADALIELCTIKKATAMKKSENFVMRRGKVLKDTVNNDARLNLVRGNETDELALYHLYTNPKAEEWFERLPEAEALEKMVAEFGEKYEAERNAKYGDGTGVTAADKVLNDANDKAVEIEIEAAKLLEDAKVEAEKIVADAKAEAVEIVKKAKTPTAPKVKAAKGDPIME